MYGIDLFGHTVVRTPDRTLRTPEFPGVKPRQILELVALGRGEPVLKTVIADRIWNGRPPAKWPITLESYVALLRRAVQPGVPGRATVLRTTPGGYRLDVERVALDLHVFDRLVRSAAGATAELALPAWERAVQMAGEPLLAGEPYASWAVEARAHQDECVLAAALRGAETALALREPGRAVPLARRATELAPLAEHGWQLLIRGLVATGRRAEAVHAFHRCRTALRRDLGLDPSPTTAQLFEQVLADRPVEAPVRLSPPPHVEPAARPGVLRVAVGPAPATALAGPWVVGL
jgi:SARP family transcriptional regulator, regulator of embCAB operon